MNGIPSRNTKKVEKPIPGCLGRVVGLFDSNAGIPGKKLLTERPHSDGYLACKKYDGRTSSSSSGNLMSDKLIGRNSSNGTTVKKLMAQEMSAELELKHNSPPNVVAKLTGLESYPCKRIDSNAKKLHPIDDAQNNEFKDVHEVRKQSGRTTFTNAEDVIEKKMAVIRRNFMESKCHSSGEKLRESKEFQDALEILNSNKDLFLKFLQETNSLCGHHLYDLQSIPSPQTKRITLLRPKAVGGDTAGGQAGRPNGFSDALSRTDSCKHVKPTRIVVLKPRNDQCHVGQSPNRGRMDESVVSSSNGYTGDESSSNKSENEYDSGAPSDIELASPCSRRSWDGGSARSSMSLGESSVCREAKRRLSSRCSVMVTGGGDEVETHRHRSSSTLGEMLGISDISSPSRSCDDDNARQERTTGTIQLRRSNSAPEVRAGAHGKMNHERSSLFKGKISSIFSSKSRRKSKEKVSDGGIGGVPQPAPRDSQKSAILDSSDSQKEVVQSSGWTVRKAEDESEDQPSPDSVLEPPFEDDDGSTSHTTNPQQPIGRSPRIESISRKAPSENYLNTNMSKSSTYAEYEHDGLHYAHALLSASGFDIRSNRKLVHDCVRAALLDVAANSREGLLGTVGERVRCLLLDWDRRVDENGGEWPGTVAERLVKGEMGAGRGWKDLMGDEVHDVGQEIEGRLVEELVEEAVIELTQNVW